MYDIKFIIMQLRVVVAFISERKSMIVRIPIFLSSWREQGGMLSICAERYIIPQRRDLPVPADSYPPKSRKFCMPGILMLRVATLIRYLLLNTIK